MRLIWVQQWTVLPVIVEDREMAEEAVQRGRLPGGGQQMDPSARNRLSDSEGPSPTRTSPISLVLFHSFPSCSVPCQESLICTIGCVQLIIRRKCLFQQHALPI